MTPPGFMDKMKYTITHFLVVSLGIFFFISMKTAFEEAFINVSAVIIATIEFRPHSD